MSMATVSISPRDCRNWPNRGNPDIRPSLRSGAQQAIHRVRLPRPTAVEECRQPGNGLSRPSRRRCLAATRIAGRWEKGARCTATSRGSCAARLLLSRLGVVHTAASSQRRDDRHRSLLVCDQRVQRPQPHLVSVVASRDINARKNQTCQRRKDRDARPVRPVDRRENQG